MSGRRVAAASVLGLACALGSARAGVALRVDRVDPASFDLQLRWESEGTGPFTLLQRDLRPVVAKLQDYPLDPFRDAVRTGLTGDSLVLTDGARLGSVEARVFEIVDESDGACSNAGYVLQRTVRAGTSTVIATPGWSAVHSLGAFLDAFPTARRVAVLEPEACRKVVLERVPGGRRGLDELVRPGRAVQADIGRDDTILMVGASPARCDGLAVTCPSASCPLPMQDRVALPFGVTWSGAEEILCGEHGVDFFDEPPERCVAGAFDGTSVTQVAQETRNFGPPLTALTVIRIGTQDRFTGTSFALDPFVGTIVAFGRARAPLQAVLAIGDAGAPAPCRCADTDGDGDDDCSERLLGTDPADPASHGPDEDADGVRDDADDCPVDADPGQADADGDGFGDACDPDPGDPANAVADGDGDGVLDGLDDCMDDADPSQSDADHDGLGDACDPCPAIASDNPGADADGDGLGDLCDTCPDDPAPDPDLDNHCSDDNCPGVPNGTQVDSDGDGFGDPCDCADRPPRADDDSLRVSAFSGSRLFRELTWADARVAPEEVFDVLGGDLSSLIRDRSFALADCLASGLTIPSFLEGPIPRDRWYLVRTRGPCEATTYGDAGPPGGPNPRAPLDAASNCP